MTDVPTIPDAQGQALAKAWAVILKETPLFTDPEQFKIFKDPAKLKQLIKAGGFSFAFGVFHLTSSRLDIVTDFAIHKFSKLSPEETHLVTAGMMFGRKGRLLADLIGHSDHVRKGAILGAFNKIRGNNKRDILVHGILYSSDDNQLEISFIDRSISGEYKAIIHKFTLHELFNYITVFTSNCTEFEKELGLSQEELNGFVMASLSLNRKSRTSPTTPNESADPFSAHQS